jgi:hypothetical protein
MVFTMSVVTLSSFNPSYVQRRLTWQHSAAGFEEAERKQAYLNLGGDLAGVFEAQLGSKQIQKW